LMGGVGVASLGMVRGLVEVAAQRSSGSILGDRIWSRVVEQNRRGKEAVRSDRKQSTAVHAGNRGWGRGHDRG
jgi:hypothetical protein